MWYIFYHVTFTCAKYCVFVQSRMFVNWNKDDIIYTMTFMNDACGSQQILRTLFGQE